MGESITITVLVEDTVNVGGLRAEHGLALLVRAGNRKLLFDTGQSDLLLDNARQMGLGLDELDAIVLSHGHYDHTGGLEAVRQAAPWARLFLHPAGRAPKFAANVDGSSRPIGMTAGSAEALRQAASLVVATAQPTEVVEGMFTTGEIPRRNAYEDTGGRYFLDAACSQADPLVDDQALYFEVGGGTVVVLGCAHSGVVNTLEYVHALTRGRPIYAVVGGMHLLAAEPERIAKTIDALRRWEVRRIIPIHCTGISALARLWAALPDRCSVCPVGTSLRFEG